MNARSLLAISVCLVGATAFAQSPIARRQVQVYNGPVRDAGVYHAATGAWTRHTHQSNLGADVVYNNSAPSNGANYFVDTTMAADTLVDEGIVPGPTQPITLQTMPGCATSYVIDGYQISWCTDQAVGATGDWRIDFYNAYTPCTSAVALTAVNSVQIRGIAGGLPGNFPAAIGTMACWILQVDPAGGLVTTTPTTTFTLLASGGAVDHFGVSFTSTLPTGTSRAGVIIAGNPNTASGFAGTRWDPIVNYNAFGTGMGTQNSFYDDGPAAGCFYYGPTVIMASYYLRLFSNACAPSTTPGFDYCFGDGTSLACPCANASTIGANEGCLNSLAMGGKLRATGVASVANDNVVLTGSQMPNSSCLYFQGTLQQGGGSGTLFGDGLRCAGGPVVRLGIKTNVASTSTYPQGADPKISAKGLVPAAGGTRTYQAWYRNAASFCTSATFNLTNGHQILWVP